MQGTVARSGMDGDASATGSESCVPPKDARPIADTLADRADSRAGAGKRERGASVGVSEQASGGGAVADRPVSTLTAADARAEDNEARCGGRASTGSWW